jgi:hypothetical protein
MTPCKECGRLVPVERTVFGKGAGMIVARKVCFHLEDRAVTKADLCRASGRMMPVRMVGAAA